MPEIAEVEIVRRRMAPLLGRTIESFSSLDPRWEPLAIEGATVTGLRRHGKLLGIDLDSEQTIEYHLRMGGNISWSEDARNVRGRLALAPRRREPTMLQLVDPRHFATLRLVDSAAWAQDLGPDLWTPEVKTVVEAVFSGPSLRRAIKATLLDQRVVAGIGNYLADEALWRCALHPQTTLAHAGPDGLACALAAAAECAHAALAIKTPETGPWPTRRAQWLQTLHAYGRAGKPCHRCERPLVKGRAAGRGSVWCEHCQVLPEHSVRAARVCSVNARKRTARLAIAHSS